MTTQYRGLIEITALQEKMFRFIAQWVKTEKTPVPRSKLIKQMKEDGEHVGAVIHALEGLIALGYIRKAVTNGAGETGIGSEKTKYVQLRTI